MKLDKSIFNWCKHLEDCKDYTLELIPSFHLFNGRQMDLNFPPPPIRYERTTHRNVSVWWDCHHLCLTGWIQVESTLLHVPHQPQTHCRVGAQLWQVPQKNVICLSRDIPRWCEWLSVRVQQVPGRWQHSQHRTAHPQHLGPRQPWLLVDFRPCADQVLPQVPPAALNGRLVPG